MHNEGFMRAVKSAIWERGIAFKHVEIVNPVCNIRDRIPLYVTDEAELAKAADAMPIFPIVLL